MMMMKAASSQVPLGIRWLLIPSVLYLAIFAVWSVAAIAYWPLVVTDTDLWYHLNGGRYLFEHGAIPRDSFFSFLAPPRPFVDYYWLFQAVVYALYAWGQEPALIGLRTALYLMMVWCVIRFMVLGEPGARSTAWGVFVAIAVSLVHLPRAIAVRPHLFSYLFIVVFLLVLERAPRRALLLPALAVLWCNLHGIAYPVMLLIAAAYALEDLAAYLRSRRSRPAWGLRRVAAAALIAGAVLATPHGAALLRVPFTSTAAASQYIQELMPATLLDLLSFHVTMMTPSIPTLFNLLLIVICVAAVLAAAKRRLRISHALLLLGAFALLLKGGRFRNEFVLLALPLLSAHPLFPSTGLTRRLPKPLYLIGSGLLMLLPLRALVSNFSNRPAYPASLRGLPYGVTTFLTRVGTGGTVLNQPNNGGYLQWRLYPAYTIFMDMQVPFLFTDEDIYLEVNAFSDRGVLGKILKIYEPSWITVPNTTKEFPELIAEFPYYVLVFFDDVEALYVNRRRAPELAQRHKLDALNPFKLAEHGVEAFLKEAKDRTSILQEARRLVDVCPVGQLANRLAAQLSNETGAYEQALPFAQAIVRDYPESATGYRLAGDAWRGLGALDRAVAAYQAGLERAVGDERPELAKALGLACLGQGRYRQAYRLLQGSINPYSTATTLEDLFHLGSSARLAGHPRAARAALRYLVHRIPPEDPVWAEKIQRELSQIPPDPG